MNSVLTSNFNMPFLYLSSGEGVITSGATGADAVLSALGTIAVLIVIIYLAYRCTKLVGSKYGAGTAVGSGKIKLLERYNLSADKYLAIVRIEQKVLLIGVSPSGIEKLEELNTEDFGETAVDASGTLKFSTLIKDALKKTSPNTETEAKKEDEKQ